MSKLKNDPTEFERMSSIFKSGITAAEVAGAFRADHLGDYARCIGIDTRRKTELAIAHLILRQTNPKPITPTPPPHEGLDPNAPECGACGGFGEAIIGDNGEVVVRRWAKAQQGKPVSVSIDMKGAPNVQGYNAELIRDVYRDIQTISAGGIKFEFLTQGKGDIHWTHVALPGNKLGAAWVPKAKGATMESAGDLSGDAQIDNDRRWEFGMLHLTVKHEALHTIGSPHSAVPNDISYAYPTALLNRGFGAGDRWFIGYAYPVSGAPA